MQEYNEDINYLKKSAERKLKLMISGRLFTDLTKI